MKSLYCIFLFLMSWFIMNMDSGSLFLSFHKIPFLSTKFSFHTSLLKGFKYTSLDSSQSLTRIPCFLYIFTRLEAMLSIFLNSPIHSTGNTIPTELQLLLK